MNIRKAVWFSRHEPTKEQLQDALEMGYEIVAIDKGRSLGSREINSRAHTHAILEHSNIHVDDDDVIVDWDIGTHVDRVVAK